MNNDNDNGNASNRSNQPEPEGTASASGEHAESTALIRKGGPRTKLGKERSRCNAVKHGFFCRVVRVRGESQAQLNALLNALREDFQPVGAKEEILVDELAALLWRKRRFVRGEAKAGGRLTVGYWDDAMGSLPMQVLIAYEVALDRRIERVLNQLERAQRIRRGQDAPPIDLNVSQHKGSGSDVLSPLRAPEEGTGDEKPKNELA